MLFKYCACAELIRNQEMLKKNAKILKYGNTYRKLKSATIITKKKCVHPQMVSTINTDNNQDCFSKMK